MYLALLCGNCGISVYKFGEDTTQGLNTQREWGHVQQKHVSDVTGQNASLDGCSDGNSLIGIDGLAWSAAKQILNSLLNLHNQTNSLTELLNF